jgi:quinol monooxygenase YgiN
MTALAILVKFTIPEGAMDKFMETAQHDAKHSMQDEPGCQQFRILVPNDTANTVYFFEVYDDEAALENHRTQPHYAVYSKVAQEIGVERERVDLTLLNP